MKNKKQRHFFCYNCHSYFKTADYKKGNPPDIGNNIGKCPFCAKDVADVPHYFANLEKMKRNASGPKDTSRSRLNGWKTGKYAKVLHLIAPALFGKYPQCEDCEFRDKCKSKEIKYCPNNLDPMLKFIAAYENGDVASIKDFAGLSQGKMYMTLQNIYTEIFDKGLLIDNKAGVFRNPLLNVIPEYMKTLGFSSDQQKMNPNANDVKETSIDGALKIEGNDFLFKLKETLKTAAISIAASNEERKKDKVLKELEKDKDKDVQTDVGMKFPEVSPFKK